MISFEAVITILLSRVTLTSPSGDTECRKALCCHRERETFGKFSAPQQRKETQSLIQCHPTRFLPAVARGDVILPGCAHGGTEEGEGGQQIAQHNTHPLPWLAIKQGPME
eukprot:TRINITY_DN41756_c0_g1_i1.p2 TRINITY_DN41756_c0_g1~~TRINITY_DN41756_c0_g1_i1.p2  ORF type:complete len:110 (-),score=2.56 TRINITY_DN41756_c0_g1_i1:17-346(-)